MTLPLSQLVEARFPQAEVSARADRDMSRDGHRHADWWAGDPLNCADCAIAIERAVQDCLVPAHVHTVVCWDDPRCPSHRGSAP